MENRSADSPLRPRGPGKVIARLGGTGAGLLELLDDAGAGLLLLEGRNAWVTT
ncbi:hypothetical protein HHL11_00595 [Ramlibacter sp. G-1-2-2]|uniref:Uncharacterized protein n=1 Tax=Ramlibacter agri TaxID=2728837 RepID=A0A848GUD0_9BURK|nr:hypothetical protein [Ramlibacter agri]NML42225.1 hypothetical protein [Ramlibacter agri]